MISRRNLVNALAAEKVADWVVVERAQELAVVAEGERPLRRSEKRTRYTLIVHHDVPRGRGTARLEVGVRDADAREIVRNAIALASAAIGPPWAAIPAAAPAKVTVLDPALEKADLDQVAQDLVAQARRPEGAGVALRAEVMRERVAVQEDQGFHTGWGASRLAVDGLVAVGGRSLELAREARRAQDLALDEALATAAADLTLLATAGAPRRGPCSVILRAEALLHGGGLGVWRVFADHANAEADRQGLTRYRQGNPVAPGSDSVSEPLSIESDGALDFALRSAPVGDEGDAVRRFPLVERGVAAGLGISPHEAARRKVDPNGGVRNLVISRGTWTDAAAPGTRTIDVHRLRSLSIDPFTGDASLELGLALDSAAGNAPFAGGTLRLDLVAALARARRSAAAIRRGAYLGPAAVLIDEAELLT